MKDINTIRKTVATMANQLHKLGYSLSNAFKTAWRRIKESMTCRVSGVAYGKRQTAGGVTVYSQQETRRTDGIPAA